MRGDKYEDKYEIALEEMNSSSPDASRAMSLLQEAEEQGDLRATYALATWYLHGTNVEKNLARAVDMLEECAAGALPTAMYDLAVCYEEGEGVNKDTDRAFELYLAAAIRGDDDAVGEVARCYLYGIGIAKDKRLAIVWYKRAEELDLGEVDYKLLEEEYRSDE